MIQFSIRVAHVLQLSIDGWSLVSRTILKKQLQDRVTRLNGGLCKLKSSYANETNQVTPAHLLSLVRLSIAARLNSLDVSSFERENASSCDRLYMCIMYLVQSNAFPYASLFEILHAVHISGPSKGRNTLSHGSNHLENEGL